MQILDSTEQAVEHSLASTGRANVRAMKIYSESSKTTCFTWLAIFAMTCIFIMVVLLIRVTWRASCFIHFSSGCLFFHLWDDIPNTTVFNTVHNCMPSIVQFKVANFTFSLHNSTYRWTFCYTKLINKEDIQQRSRHAFGCIWTFYLWILVYKVYL